MIVLGDTDHISFVWVQKAEPLQLCKAQNTHAPTISSILVDGIYSKVADRYPDFGSPRTIRLPGTEHSSGMCMVLPDTVAELCRILTCFPDICCQLFDKKGFSNAHVLLYHIFRRLASLFAKKSSPVRISYRTAFTLLLMLANASSVLRNLLFFWKSFPDNGQNTRSLPAPAAGFAAPLSPA